jgi:hypothetical protein
MKATMRSQLAMAFALIVGLPAFGQISFDTFPKIPKMPDLTKSEEQVMNEFHEFLWQHWVDKKRAIAQIRGVSREGSPSLITILIGPDERQRWVITEVFQSSGFIEGGMMDLPSALKISTSIEVVTVNPDRSVRVVPNPKAPFSRSYQLRFKGPNGYESIF